MPNLDTSFTTLMPKVIHRPKLILASQSSSRKELLENIGLDFVAITSSIDEEPIKAMGKKNEKSIENVAMELAIAKAKDVAEAYSEAYVFGCDQMMQCEGVWFDKARSISEAKEQLQFLRGKTHQLYTAVCCVLGKDVIWEHLAIGDLTMWGFDDDFIDNYLDHMGPKVLQSVGCYPIEKRGASLFVDVKQDIFTVRGLPVFALLSFLRTHGILFFR